jgi:hypothetical protein
MMTRAVVAIYRSSRKHRDMWNITASRSRIAKPAVIMKHGQAVVTTGINKEESYGF